MKLPIRLAVLVSGGGSTAFFIWVQTQLGGVLYGVVEIVCIMVTRGDAPAKKRLEDAGYAGDLQVLDPRKLGRRKYASEILRLFAHHAVDWYGMYGCLVKMPRAVIKKYRGINQHPALAPFFGGKGMYSLAPHEMVVLFTRACGCTVFTWAIAQLVDPNYDQGGIIYAIPLQVDPNETAEQLQERLLPFEHKVQLAALLLIAGLLGEVPPTMKGLFPLRRGDKALLAKCRRQALENCPRGKRRVS